jgi:hypothetical protein
LEEQLKRVPEMLYCTV